MEPKNVATAARSGSQNATGRFRRYAPDDLEGLGGAEAEAALEQHLCPRLERDAVPP